MGDRTSVGEPVRLREDGLLWAINAQILHPRGFALSVNRSGNLSLLGDGSEVWGYADSVEADIDERFKAFEALLARARITNMEPPELQGAPDDG